jgi:hypothetical protein
MENGNAISQSLGPFLMEGNRSSASTFFIRLVQAPKVTPQMPKPRLAQLGA